MDRRTFFRNALIGASALFSLPSWGYDQNDNYIDHATIPPVWDATYKLIFNNSGRQGHGSCMAFRKDTERTYLLTAHHVVRDPLAEYNVILDGEQTPAKIEFVDELHDLAVISVERNDLYTHGQFARPEHVHTNDLGYIVGFPFSQPKSLTMGRISTIEDTTYYWLDQHVNPGNSGGPFFLLDRGIPVVAGVVSCKISNGEGVVGVVRLENILNLLSNRQEVYEREMY